MFEETRKYTEETYRTKDELAEELELEGVVLEAVWKQIEEYRSLFRREFNFSIFSGSLVLTATCCRKLQHTSELLFRCHKEQGTASALQKVMLLVQGQKHWLQRAMELLSLPHLACDVSAFLEDEEEPLLLRCFLLSVLHADTQICACILLHAACPVNPTLICEQEVYQKTASDLTPRFLAFLDGIRLQISRSMLSLTETDITASQTMQLQELQERFPELSERQLLFYVDHRKPYCYYTIRQFMEYAGVCNETARCAMEQLVHQQCYQRRRVGKKYVYYTV